MIRPRSINRGAHWNLLDHEFGDQVFQIGLGDYLQYSRYFHRLEQIESNVTVKCSLELHRLFKFNFPNINFVQTTPSYYDHWFFGCSFPAILGVHKYQPYLKSSEKSSLQECNDLKIGICWASAVPSRSLPLRALEPILETLGCKFWAIQKGPALSELGDLQKLKLINYLDLNDFLIQHP